MDKTLVSNKFFYWFLVTFMTTVVIKECWARSFSIDYQGNRFLKDGLPYQYISGSIHYFRVPQAYWRDRLQKAKAAGLTAVSTYVPWNLHQPEPERLEFSGIADLADFLNAASETGLDVILRPGPYICAEWEHGGLPWWILQDPDIRIRTSDSRFLNYVRTYFERLLPYIQPFLYRNGGPITMVQVENEYGSFYACDRVYMEFLRDLMRAHLGEDTVLFTTDGGAESYLKCGSVPGVYPTVDFGPSAPENIDAGFAAQRIFAPKGPLVNSEFYTTWLDKFGNPWAYGVPDIVVSSVRHMYSKGASFNFYMFEGGTNFGYMASGSHPKLSELPYFTSMATSYDYDAPLSEAGDPRYPLYHMLRDTITSLTGVQPPPIPEPTPKENYGSVRMQFAGKVLDLLHILSPVQVRTGSSRPLDFIALKNPYGFVLYEHIVKRDGAFLSTPDIGDRGYVTVNGNFQGFLVRGSQMGIAINCRTGDVLRILVENIGRQNYWRGPVENDPKGIRSAFIDGEEAIDWTNYPLTLENIFNHDLDELSSNTALNEGEPFQPSIYLANFRADQTIADTFANPEGWGKGQLFINGQNIGRYWPSLGPQITLYVPKTVLHNENRVMMLELEHPGNCDPDQGSRRFCSMRFDSQPIIGSVNQACQKNSLCSL